MIDLSPGLEGAVEFLMVALQIVCLLGFIVLAIYVTGLIFYMAIFVGSTAYLDARKWWGNRQRRIDSGKEKP